ncbi:bifunctional UDP-N-acetylglucosamine diphosphorylase/glucosamine-1-phosphate N-acetyltransferase GlmU [Natroniella sulfidigena]|uniref:bifunctional UDP-N-acetylglucosamine diphosphorylase/glucosamine-1-phosphate N-acetyltransferase GlmU n=1 Tax=Natroniella sulfidigena TaxID=723921 RepID=UPI00200B81A2|nr:bifunctional UDP-N-acetylglucosamine diphosphorylase/glucosamine-1-phosphate N-acetyltransferase GlmU [Natroniella sulfidigena]MCK8817032.1 bifunctional UDP-N-acetylglucosamine diphosphorylase/glucosamine-1-phosphate N-acetyltransferase GlmU [Natroniella sulfidigena]
MANLATITLAAGKGTRMKSSLPKVLHQVAGKSMVQHVVDTAGQLTPQHNLVIVGYKADQVKADTDGKIEFVKQEQQLGTGHAVMQAKEELIDFSGVVLVLYGDTPLLTSETLQQLIEQHQTEEAAATILTTKVDDPTGYGRIVRDQSDYVTKIVEEKDTTAEEAKINEINTGICCFESDLLWDCLAKLDTDNAQGEYYLTDVPEILVDQGHSVSALSISDTQQTIGVNTRKHLAEAEQILRQRICNYHLENGVTIIDPANTYIDSEVEIGQDSIIYPFTFLEGKTKLGSEVIIGPQTRIIDSMIGNQVEIKSSTIIDSQIGERSEVGPYAYLRPGSKLSSEVKVGDFVEIKKSEIAKGAKVPHLSYIGDALIGQNTNIGAGTITANYDGQQKHRTVIGDNVFIGSDSTLIAPLRIGDQAITGAGAVVTKDVEADSLVLGVPAEPRD